MATEAPTTAVSLLRDNLLEFEGTPPLEYIDVLRTIYNSGFSAESVRKGLANPNPQIRAGVQKYLDSVQQLKAKSSDS
jgi:hypothetical protein